MPDMGAVVNQKELKALLVDLHKQGKRVVTTNGCFDLLHVGHTRILNSARQLGDVLIVGVNSDRSVKELKGPSRPITPQDERAEILGNLSCVDYVYIFDESTPVEFLKMVRPYRHVKGSDYDPKLLAETPVVEGFGGKVVILDLIPGHSTSSITEKMN